MPTQNPRLTITLQPAVAAVVKRMADLTKQSQSALIGELLEQVAPVLERTIVVLEAAEEAKTAVKAKMADDFGQAQAKIEKQLGLALDHFDSYTGGLLAEVEKVKRRATRRPGTAVPARAAAAASTPLSNRGVRSTPKRTKKSTGTRG